MLREPKVISIDSPAYRAHKRDQQEGFDRLLNALQPQTELERTIDLSEVMRSVRHELRELQRHNPDSKSLGEALNSAEAIVRALERREAALGFDSLPF